MTGFTIGLIAAALWVSVMVGTAVYLRSAPRSARQSIRRYRENRQSVGKVPVVVRSLSREVKGAQIRVTSTSLGELEPVTATGSQSLHSGIPFLGSRSKGQEAKTKRGAKPAKVSKGDQDTPRTKLLSDFFNHPGNEDDEATRAIAVGRGKRLDRHDNWADHHNESDGPHLPATDDPDEASEQWSGPVEPSQSAGNGKTPAPAGSLPPTESTITSPSTEAADNSSPDMDALLGWINAGSPKLSVSAEPIVVQTASSPSPQPPEPQKPPPRSALVQVPHSAAIHKVGNISYVLVDDDGRPLLE